MAVKTECTVPPPARLRTAYLGNSKTNFGLSGFPGIVLSYYTPDGPRPSPRPVALWIQPLSGGRSRRNFGPGVQRIPRLALFRPPRKWECPGPGSATTHPVLPPETIPPAATRGSRNSSTRRSHLLNRYDCGIAAIPCPATQKQLPARVMGGGSPKASLLPPGFPLEAA